MSEPTTRIRMIRACGDSGGSGAVSSDSASSGGASGSSMRSSTVIRAECRHGRGRVGCLAMSRREKIVMTGDEAAAFLDEQRTVICATVGRDGWPHLMPLWYVVRDGECWAWTYAKSQKVRNLKRDPRCTIEVETGEQYDELRGAMFKAECEI